MKPVVLRTPRLVLSTPVAADAPTVYEHCQDAALQHWTTVPVPIGRDGRDEGDGDVPMATGLRLPEEEAAANTTSKETSKTAPEQDKPLIFRAGANVDAASVLWWDMEKGEQCAGKDEIREKEPGPGSGGPGPLPTDVRREEHGGGVDRHGRCCDERR